jgi:hypothetical protein
LIHLLPWLVAAFAAGFAVRETGPLHVATACIVASGALLGLVDWLHRRCGRQLARALADVALLTPLVPWLLAGMT